MALLAVQRQGAVVATQGEALVVRLAGVQIAKRPIHELDGLQLYGAISVTPGARERLLKAGVDVVFLTLRGSYVGRLIGPTSLGAERRQAQYRVLGDAEKGLQLARAVLRGKLKNQRTLVGRLRRDHESPETTAAWMALKRLLLRIPQVESQEALMGVEGQAAHLYFRALGASISHPELSFERRTRRPPQDPVNACLSFGYTLLLARVESAIRTVGLDPYLGGLHSAGRGKPALALDLMEELRPLVDRMVMRLVNRRQLGPDDFRDVGRRPADVSRPPGDADEPGPAVFLGASGRAIFFGAWGALLRQRFARGEPAQRFELSDILTQQAQRAVAFFVRGEPYEPFLMS